MAKMRYIKPEILTDEKTVLLSDSALKLFVGLLLHSDDSGVHPYSLITIKAEIFPLDRKTTKKIEQLLGELFKNELIEHYAVDNHKYLLIKNFTRHQVIPPNRASYRHPLANGKIPKKINKSNTYDLENTVEAPPEQCQDSAEAVPKQWHNTIKDKRVKDKRVKDKRVKDKSVRVEENANPPTEILFEILTAENKYLNLNRGAVDAYVNRFPNLNVSDSLAKMEGRYKALPPERRWRYCDVLVKVNNWLADDAKGVAV